MQERTPAATVTAALSPVPECRGHTHPHHHDHSHHKLPLEPVAPALGGVLLSARGLGMKRGGRTILDDIDLDVGAGEIVTLVGPNGAGKTTLVRVMLGLEAPDNGRTARAPGLVVGYVPQRFDIERSIPLTVTRFLTLGQPASHAEAMKALEEVGAAAVERQQLDRLSGGELQRVLLARALLRRPHLLVLDEPVAGVDYVGEAELYTLIGRLREQRRFGVLLISHDLHVVMAQSDRVICLNRHVCCSGVPHTVARHPEYVRLFGNEAALALGVYHHDHDHRHDIDGAPHGDHSHHHDAHSRPPAVDAQRAGSR
jgi:zinc transport system ATP-binding protein